MGGLITALFILIALPPNSVELLSYIALVPFFLLTLGKPFSRVTLEAGALGMVSAMYGYWGAFFENPMLYMVCTAMFTAGYLIIGVLTALMSRTNEKFAWVTLAIIWTIPEQLFPLLGLPFSYTVLLVDNIPLLQFASYVGSTGVILMLFSLQAWLAVNLKRNIKRLDAWGGIRSIILFTMTTMLLSYGGHWIERNTIADSVIVDHVVSVQTALEPEVLDLVGLPGHIERIASEISELVENIKRYPGDMLVVWPESILPGVPMQIENDIVKSIYRLRKRQIVHAYSVNETGATESGGWLINREGRPVASYDKTNPVPFVEEYGQPETIQKPLESNDRNIGVMICNDSSYIENYLNYRNAGADYLAVLTNDAYAGPSILSYLHIALERIRAIESGLGIVRAANGGPSTIITPTGRLLEEMAIFENGLVSGAIEKTIGATFYGRYRYLLNIIYWAALGIILLIITNEALKETSCRRRLASRCMGILRYSLLTSLKPIYRYSTSFANLSDLRLHGESELDQTLPNKRQNNPNEVSSTKHKLIILLTVNITLAVISIVLQYQSIGKLYKDSITREFQLDTANSHVSVTNFIERDLGFMALPVKPDNENKHSSIIMLKEKGLLDISYEQPYVQKHKHVYGVLETKLGSIVLIQDKGGELLIYSERTGRLHKTSFDNLKTMAQSSVSWFKVTVKNSDKLTK